MITKLLLVVMLSLAVPSFSQKQGQEKIDSILAVLKVAKQDSTKVNTLNALSYEFRSNDPDTAIYFANEALALATKTNYKMGIANAYLSLGAATMNLGKYEEALKNNMDALKIYDQLLGSEKATGKSKILKLKARAYNNIGNIYDNQGDYPEALKNNFAALKIREETGDKTGIAASYNNIGNIYVAQGNYPEGLKNLFAALKIKEETGDKKSIANTYNNIGSTYYNQGDYYQALKSHFAALKIRQEIGDKGGIATSYNNIGIIYDDKANYSEALKYHFAALKIEEEIGDAQGIALSYENIGLIYMHQNDYNKALKYLLAYLKSSEEIEDKSSIADAYINIGNVYTKQKKNNDAALYLNKGLLFAKEVGSLDYIKAAYNGLAKLDSVQGNFKQALVHYELYISYRDSLFNEENTKKLVQSQMQYEFDKKESLAKAEQEKKDAVAQREKNMQYFVIASLGILVLAVVIIAFIQWRNNKQKQAANLLLTQQKEKVESTLTELKSTQAQLIQSAKMASLGELTAGIAHEIQNPLNFVNNFSEVSNELLGEMKTELASGNGQEAITIADDVKQNLEKIIHHGKRADAIVKGMLQHSRTSSGQKEPTDINALSDEYLRLSYHGMRAKDKSLSAGQAGFNATLQTDFDTNIEKINIVPQDIGRV
jgi:two-component system NtrC family sensor kinase